MNQSFSFESLKNLNYGIFEAGTSDFMATLFKFLLSNLNEICLVIKQTLMRNLSKA